MLQNLRTNTFCLLQLVEELEVLLKEASEPQDAQRYQEALINLRELIHHKHKLTTEEILKVQNSES